VPDEAIEHAIRELVKGRSGMSPMLANKQVYELIKEGYTATILNKDGREEPRKIKFIKLSRWRGSDSPAAAFLLLCPSQKACQDLCALCQNVSSHCWCGFAIRTQPLAVKTEFQ
jgi:hypothetical protein